MTGLKAGVREFESHTKLNIFVHAKIEERRLVFFRHMGLFDIIFYEKIYLPIYKKRYQKHFFEIFLAHSIDFSRFPEW